ncbi:Na+/H+ antiporter subunit E [Rhodobacteraceae bacterium DSL-40]|uniref:Na+/H+ antiporter subunit E n=1 Tax=Amaricoccus sp. B4 TaxID=3368557 RepID=UPI000DACCBB2
MITFLKRCMWFVVLFVLFCWDLVVSSVLVAATVIAPTGRSKPRLVTIPLQVKSDAGITMVANFISLTPGTLSVDVSPDRSTLLVHSLLAGESSEETRREVREGIEARVLRVTGT